MQIVTDNKLKNNRRNLLIILAVFAVPVLLSSMMYFGGWRPSATGNHGELIQPAHFIEDRNMLSLDGMPIKFSDLHGKWTMLYFDTAACPDECIDRLYFMRQTHHSQGKYLDSIQRVFVLTDDKSVNNLKSKLAEYPDMKILTASKDVLSSLIKEFGLDTSNDVAGRNIFLLDPLGNLMMRYRSNVDPAGVRKDMERLLKYSAEGK